MDQKKTSEWLDEHEESECKHQLNAPLATKSTKKSDDVRTDPYSIDGVLPPFIGTLNYSFVDGCYLNVEEEVTAAAAADGVQARTVLVPLDAGDVALVGHRVKHSGMGGMSEHSERVSTANKHPKPIHPKAPQPQSGKQREACAGKHWTCRAPCSTGIAKRTGS